MKGIDVSTYQGTIDWKQVKEEQVAFAILKIINKNGSVDNQFEANYTGCLLAGIPIGVYNYSYATTVERGLIDATAVLAILKGRKLQQRVWLDVEDEVQKNMGMQLVDIILAYKNLIEKNGYEFGVYTGLSFYQSYLQQYAKYFNCPFWIARYPKTVEMFFAEQPSQEKTPIIQNELWAWQYSSKGKVKGIKGNVDLNLVYKKEEIPVAPFVEVTAPKTVQQFFLSLAAKNKIAPNFAVEEFRCKDGNDTVLIDVGFVLKQLQNIRTHFKLPITIISGYRTKEYNKQVGGADQSYHMLGRAFDVAIQNVSPEEIAKYAQTLGINGIIQYENFVHLDSREKKYWARNIRGKIQVVDGF